MFESWSGPENKTTISTIMLENHFLIPHSYYVEIRLIHADMTLDKVLKKVIQPYVVKALHSTNCYSMSQYA